MIIGGVVAGLGIENPRAGSRRCATRGSAAAGECGHDADCGSANAGHAVDEAPAPEPCIESRRVSRSSSPASSRPAASTSATTSARSASTSRARTAASRRSTASSTCTRSRSPTTRPSCASALYDTTAILLAAGLDPERCILFRQSDVREHTELTWLLSAVTAHGDLNRMHQFKEKSAQPARAGLGGALLLPGADGRRRARLPGDRGAGRRRPAPARRADAGDRPPLQRALRRDAGRAGAADPRGRRPDHGPAGAGAEDVDHRRHRGGHGLRARRARRDPQEARQRRHRLRARGRPRRPTSPGSPT